MFLPHMAGSSAPVVDFRSRAGFVGLSSVTSRGDILRAVIEGLDFRFLEILLAMEKHLYQDFHRVVIVGGAVRNEFWMQNKADVVGRPLEVSDEEEATPLGAAKLAGIGVGAYSNISDAYEAVKKPTKAYLPNEATATRHSRSFQIYRQLYDALKDVHHAISDNI